MSAGWTPRGTRPWLTTRDTNGEGAAGTPTTGTIPPGMPDSNGEGPDCSGLVFKTWELRNTANDGGFTYDQAMQNIHGVYTSYDFHSPVASDPFSAISK